MPTPDHPKTIFWSAMAVFTTLLTLGMLALLVLGCSSFEKARRKYATSHVDTTFLTLHTVVPRDSAVLRLVTDTTTVVHEYRQGRARIIYQRNPKVTLVRADCDSVIVEKKIPQYITKQVWGVDPAYQNKAQRWRTIALILAALLGLAAIGYIVSRTLSIRIRKR